jgi:hypothetical protein
MLPIIADGRELLPDVIFKRKISFWNTRQGPGEGMDRVRTHERFLVFCYIVLCKSLQGSDDGV